MDVELLARLQFAFTIMYHYIYPQLSIGLGLLLVFMEGAYLKTGLPIYLKMAKFWTKIFALTFALGVATGIVMEFEFGTNWSTYSRYVGDVFGSALAAEGVFAFFLESGFLALVLFGWERVGKKMHFFATCMVCLGAHFSAIWIIVANSWMQTPAGYHIVGEGLHARAEITDFWAMVFNPSAMDRLTHSVIGAWLSGVFLVIGVSAYYLYKKKHPEFGARALQIALPIALIALLLQLIVGDKSARGVAVNQPAKLAAFEGLFTTEKGLPLIIMGVPNLEKQQIDYGLKVPKLLSLLTFHDPEAEIKGLDTVPQNDWPNVKVVFQTYRLMIGMWGAMLLTTLLAIYFWQKKSLASQKWLLRLMMMAPFFPQIANQAGWMSAEMGRYPWIVYGHLRISEGLSKSVTAGQVLGSIILFGLVYTFLFILFIYLLHEKIVQGPEYHSDKGPEDIYHMQSTYLKAQGLHE